MVSAIKKCLCFSIFLLFIGLVNITAEASEAYVPKTDIGSSVFTPLHQQIITQYTPTQTLPKADAVPEIAEKEPEVPAITVSTYDAELIAKTIYGEACGVSPMEQAAVAWCILNRADAYGVSVEAVVTAPYQFLGYKEYMPITPEIYDIAVDVLTRHAKEKMGETDVGRVLPSNYLWFSGDMVHNYFRDGYSLSSNTWDWSLPNPYAVQ